MCATWVVLCSRPSISIHLIERSESYMIQFMRGHWQGGWEASNPTLAEGQPAVVVGQTISPQYGDTTTVAGTQLKIGDGKTSYKDLPFVGDNRFLPLFGGTLRGDLELRKLRNPSDYGTLRIGESSRNTSIPTQVQILGDTLQMYISNPQLHHNDRPTYCRSQ